MDKLKAVKVDGISFTVDPAISQGKEKFIREHIATHYAGLSVKDRALKLAAAFDIIVAKKVEDSKKVEVVDTKPVVDKELEAAISGALNAKAVPEQAKAL